MIVKWNLKNFKSIEDVTLTLSPLSIFAGANSSGKSSILQSLLLISQTFKDTQHPGSPLVLNGNHLTRPLKNPAYIRFFPVSAEYSGFTMDFRLQPFAISAVNSSTCCLSLQLTQPSGLSSSDYKPPPSSAPGRRPAPIPGTAFS